MRLGGQFSAGANSLYGDHKMDPLRRSQNGADTPVGDTAQARRSSKALDLPKQTQFIPLELTCGSSQMSDRRPWRGFAVSSAYNVSEHWSVDLNHRSLKRAALPSELPRVELHHEPDSTSCTGGCQLRRVGEDVSAMLEYIPGAQAPKSIPPSTQNLSHPRVCTPCRAPSIRCGLRNGTTGPA